MITRLPQFVCDMGKIVSVVDLQTLIRGVDGNGLSQCRTHPACRSIVQATVMRGPCTGKRKNIKVEK